MSDLFIGEILVLSLLLIVLLRPFFRRMQRIEGIALFPLLSLLMCLAIIAGVGLRISFIPVLLFSILLFFSGLSRLIRLFLRLPTDWYSPVAVGYSCFLLVLLAGALYIAVVFTPEEAYRSEKLVKRTVFQQKVGPGIIAQYTIVAPVESSQNIQDRPLVIFSGDITSGAGGRNTTAWILAGNGFTVIESDFQSNQDYQNPLLYFPVFRKFLLLSEKISKTNLFLTDVNEIDQVQEKELSRLVGFAQKQYGSAAKLFIVSEGTGAAAALSRRMEDSTLFDGVVCIVSEASAAALISVPGGFVTVSIDSGMMPSNAGAAPVMLLTGAAALLPGFGELAADDVLAALLCGVKRDAGRKNAELTGQRILTWLLLRRNYESKGS